jgi:dihydrofolate synthase/folylpolyglutamate synthase
MNFEETLEYLYNLLPMFQRVGKKAFKKDLTNTLALCEHLGNPQEKFKSVHIAGTNGKGSSAHMIASGLQEADYKTGLYTSPHLYRFTERIRINGKEVEPGFIVDFVAKHKGAIESIMPSFFELTVAMTFDYFARNHVDVTVIETGLGGRLDSTNVLKPAVSLITNISLDHTDMLGETLVEIAGEKAGIIKKGIPAVVGEYQEEIAGVFREKALAEDAPLYFADKSIEVNKERSGSSGENQVSIYGSAWGTFHSVQLDNSGDYQIKNLPGVIKVLEVLNGNGLPVHERNIRAGLMKVKKNTGFWGRWEALSKDPLVICDTAHNEAGVKSIVSQLEKLEYDRLHIIWGMVADKNAVKIMKLLPRDAGYYFCQALVPRAMDAFLLMEKAKEAGREGIVFRDVNEAIHIALTRAGKGDVILIGGSNFVIAEINREVYEKKTAKI